MSAERSGPAICNVSNIGEGKDEMTKASIDLQDLRRRIYVKAKAEPSWRFWGLYVHVCKMETLRAAYAMAKQNDGAPGRDGVTFEVIEAHGVEALLEQLCDELTGRTYKPLPARKQEIPKDGGKVRVLSIPAISGQSGAGCAKAHPRTCVRGGLPTGVVWISAQADSTRRDQASGGSNSSAEDAGPRL